MPQLGCARKQTSHETSSVKLPTVKFSLFSELAHIFAVSLTAADCLCPLCTFLTTTTGVWFVTSIWLQLSLLSLSSTTAALHAHTPLGQHVAVVCFATLLVCLPGPEFLRPFELRAWSGKHLPEENKHDSLRWRHLPFESERGCLNSCQSTPCVSDLRWQNRGESTEERCEVDRGRRPLVMKREAAGMMCPLLGKLWQGPQNIDACPQKCNSMYYHITQFNCPSTRHEHVWWYWFLDVLMYLIFPQYLEVMDEHQWAVLTVEMASCVSLVLYVNVSLDTWCFKYFWDCLKQHCLVFIH